METLYFPQVEVEISSTFPFFLAVCKITLMTHSGFHNSLQYHEVKVYRDLPASIMRAWRRQHYSTFTITSFNLALSHVSNSDSADTYVMIWPWPGYRACKEQFWADFNVTSELISLRCIERPFQTNLRETEFWL